MPDIFLSYSREDQEVARRYAEAFRTEGFDVWWDVTLRSGEDYDEVTEKALRDAKAVVVLWSRTSVVSRWVRAEATQAHRNKTLVPAMIEACDRPIMFELTQTAELSHWQGDAHDTAWRALVGDIQRLIGSRPPAEKPAAPTPRQAPGTASICVLPFCNMSGDLEQEYFSDGISEDIITDLSKVSALSVVSRNTAFSYKGKNVKVRQVANELGVTHVLEGSVRKSGGRVRITAQLIDGINDAHVWAERFDRDLNDIFAVQDEISEAIVMALRLKLLPEEKKAIERRGTENVEAYNIYLMARQHYVFGILTEVRKNETVIRLCHAALDLDPNYADAWALLATAQRNHFYAAGIGDNGSEAAERALALDDNLAEAHSARAGGLAAEGRYDEARREIDAALRLDPNSVDVHREAARLAFHQGRLEDAIVHWEFVSQQIKTDYAAGCLIITALKALGLNAELVHVARRTLERAEQAVKQEPNSGAAMAALVTALAVLGETERARSWAKRAVLVEPDNYSMRYNLACDFVANLNEADAALDMLEPMEEAVGAERLAWMKADPDFKALRDHPRFQAMVARCEARLGKEAAPEPDIFPASGTAGPEKAA